jgi:hypothetical protein
MPNRSVKPDSAKLESTLEKSRRARELARIEASVAQYYSSTTEVQRSEIKAWGKFVESEQRGQ